MDKVDSSNDSFVNPEGIKLFRIVYPSSIEPTKAIVFVCHGLFEHCRSSYYETIIRPLNDIGCMIITHDHKGHGLSDGPRGMIDDFEHLVRDVLLDIDDVLHLQINKDSLPIFIYGHSMGGLITVDAVLQRSNFFTGMCLESPLIKFPESQSAIVISCGRFISRIFPWFPASSVNYDDLSRNKEFIEAEKHDKLRIHSKVPLKTAVELIDAVQLANNCLKDIKTPFIVGHGDDDHLCSIEGSKTLVEMSSTTDKKLVVYPKAKHVLRMEIDNVKVEFRQEIVNWIKDRIK